MASHRKADWLTCPSRSRPQRKGISTYAEAKAVDWWTDEEMINGWVHLVTFRNVAVAD